MILADKIIELRKQNGWSQEDLAEKMDVSRQAISKWEGAQSVPDMGRIVRLSELFGVSTDYLLKDDMEREEAVALPDEESAYRTVSMEEASAFLSVKEKMAPRIALGVMLCILSPIALILLGGASATGKLALSDVQATGIGLTILLLMVGSAVAIFITSSIQTNRFEYLEKEPIETLYGVSGMVRSRKESFQPTYTRQLTIGIVLCVLSAIPLFMSMLFTEEDFVYVIAICTLLAMAAVGVLLIVRSSIIWGSFQQLLEEGDYSREAKAESKKYGWIAGSYWMLVTAGYLAWSFITNNWQNTWIVWPVAAVAFAAIYEIAKAMKRKNG